MTDTTLARQLKASLVMEGVADITLGVTGSDAPPSIEPLLDWDRARRIAEEWLPAAHVERGVGMIRAFVLGHRLSDLERLGLAFHQAADAMETYPTTYARREHARALSDLQTDLGYCPRCGLEHDPLVACVETAEDRDDRLTHEAFDREAVERGEL